MFGVFGRNTLYLCVVLFFIDLGLCLHAEEKTSFCLSLASTPDPWYTHPVRSVHTYCTTLALALAHPAYGHPPTHTKAQNTHTVAHMLVHQDVRGVSQHLWLSTVSRWVLDFPPSAVATCQNRKLLYMLVYFSWLPPDTIAAVVWFC